MRLQNRAASANSRIWVLLFDRLAKALPRPGSERRLLNAQMV